PVSGFKFYVSHKKWVRPNVNNDPEDSLYPDIEVYTTIDDILNKRDPQIEKLVEIINEKQNVEY
ncbi:MAG: peptidase S41, partial [Thermosipho sp. (in: Bacteria)]|nr:peptidase S41 [Thermosipho sp. (in: thermotogales)]